MRICDVSYITQKMIFAIFNFSLIWITLRSIALRGVIKIPNERSSAEWILTIFVFFTAECCLHSFLSGGNNFLTYICICFYLFYAASKSISLLFRQSTGYVLCLWYLDYPNYFLLKEMILYEQDSWLNSSCFVFYEKSTALVFLSFALICLPLSFTIWEFNQLNSINDSLLLKIKWKICWNWFHFFPLTYVWVNN